ncbi:hypothetical protein QBC40DRAFT_23239 [Triangularia verruculosa]|uniref:Uncharacterized protein n=1 Tax=Triangularia verruculosa TaxID=2587418 RepID=A0AAN6X7B4_9PEZI|nr:hypothetical protein QBC40DRAFT_23239 [Triangularia verruculosa]
MPFDNAPEQQQPMEAIPLDGLVTEQPSAEPQPEVGMRGGFVEECDCCCCGEECVCC